MQGVPGIGKTRLDKGTKAPRLRKDVDLRAPDREGVTRALLAHLRIGPGRGVARHDVEHAHASVPLTYVTIHFRPCPRLALNSLTERLKGPNAARESFPSIEPGAEESDHRSVGKLLEFQPGATRGREPTGRSAATKGRGGVLVDGQRDKPEGSLGMLPWDRAKAL